MDSNDGKSMQEFVVATVNKFDVFMQMMHHLCRCNIHSNSIFQCCFLLTLKLTRVKFNDLQWSIEKTHQTIWDALQNYDRIEWKWTLSDLERPWMWLTKMLLLYSIQHRGVKGLIMTRSNLVWSPGRSSPISILFLDFPLVWVGPPEVVVFWSIHEIGFSICAKKNKKTYSCEINAMIRGHL